MFSFKKMLMGGFSSQRASNAKLWWFICCWNGQAVEQRVPWPVIWDSLLFTVTKMTSLVEELYLDEVVQIGHDCSAMEWDLRCSNHRFVPEMCKQRLVLHCVTSGAWRGHACRQIDTMCLIRSTSAFRHWNGNGIILTIFSSLTAVKEI